MSFLTWTCFTGAIGLVAQLFRRSTYTAMKNQYFGDLSDFHKYGLLRALTGKGRVTTTVCWMLTPDDSHANGRRTQYLEHAVEWRPYDAELFDCLHQKVSVEGARRIDCLPWEKLLPKTRFYEAPLRDAAYDRTRYFNGLWRLADGSDLIFFDPDNGMEVKSRPYGRKYSSKYLYWRELTRAYLRGFAVLVYQHFPRVAREPFVQDMAREMFQRTGARKVYSFQTSHVVFFLLLSRYRKADIERNIKGIKEKWDGQIYVRQHRHPFETHLRMPTT